MKTQRGIADTWLTLIALAAVIGGLWYAYQTVDHRAYLRGQMEVQVKFDKFKQDVAEAGRKAEAAKAASEAKAERDKEKANAENKDLRRELDVRRRQLRDARAGANGGVVPGPTPGARSPETASFDRAKLDRALRDFIEGTESLIGEGADAIIDLDTAKRWASGGSYYE